MLAGGTAAAQVIAVASAPVLTRLYTPEGMGQWGLYAAFLAITAIVSTMAYELAIVSARATAESRLLLRAAGRLVVPGSLVCGLVLYVLIAGSLMGFSILPVLTVVPAVVALAIGGTASLLRASLIYEQDFGVLSRSQVAQSVSRVAGQIALGVAGLGWLGLVMGDLIGKVVSVVQMFLGVRKHLPTKTSPESLGRSWPALKAHWRYPLFIVPSSLVDAFAQNLPLPVIAALYGSAEAGYFALAQRILSVPSSLVGASIADVFHARLAECRRSNPAGAVPLLYRVTALLVAIGIVPTVLLALAAPPLFQWVFGAQWRTAGEMASILAVLALAQLIVSPLSRAVAVYDGQHLKLFYDAISLVGMGAVLFVGRRWHLELRETVIGLTAAQLVAYAYYFLVIIRLVHARRA